MADTLQTYTDQTWEKDVLGSPQPVLVDFWAEWCVPCHMVSPVVEEIARDFADRMKAAKLNVEENEKAPFDYNIRTLPTLLLFKGGKVTEQYVGLISKENLQKLLEPHVR